MSVVAALPEEFSVVVDLGMWKPTKSALNELMCYTDVIDVYSTLNTLSYVLKQIGDVCVRRYVHTCTLHVSTL